MEQSPTDLDSSIRSLRLTTAAAITGFIVAVAGLCISLFHNGKQSTEITKAHDAIRSMQAQYANDVEKVHTHNEQLASDNEQLQDQLAKAEIINQQTHIVANRFLHSLLSYHDAFRYTGMRLGEANPKKVVYTAEGLPAHDAGIRKGDILMMIDGQPTLGCTAEEIAALITRDGSIGPLDVSYSRNGSIESTTINCGLVVPSGYMLMRKKPFSVRETAE